MADGVTSVDKRPPWRPTAYKPEHCETVIELGRMGYSRARMAAHIGVAKQTLDNWAAANPDFLAAYTHAKTLAQAHWEQRGYSGLDDRNFNSPLYLGTMKSMFRDDYMDRSVNEIVGKDGEAIEVKELGSDARAVAFMLGRAVGRAEKAKAEKSDS